MSPTEATAKPMTLGQIFVACRKKAGDRVGRRITQEHMGMLLLPQVSRETISRWERDIEEPRFTHAVQIAKLGDWDVDQIVALIPGVDPSDPDDDTVTYLGVSRSTCTSRDLLTLILPYPERRSAELADAA